MHRAQWPEEWAWGLPEQLMASVVDTLRIANWQRTTAKPQDFPWPLPRPGVEPQTKTVGGDGALSIDDMNAWLGWDKTA